MEKEEELGTDLCRTRIQDDEQKLQRATFGFDRSGQSFQLMRTDNCRTVGVMDCSQLAGDEKPVAGSELQVTARMDASVSTGAMMKVEKLVVAENSLGKRKRGRPQRSQGRATPVPKKEKEKEEDDVCFICFDGGSLVLCDTRGCPKAYHPACIKRDESFFQSKAKWSCGWHICNSCQNASYFMCYTCTYSLCKWCTKDADYVRVRGSMGFCGTCMRTIMLLENSGQGNKEAIQVDFDDVTSWEYLFKMYWTPLKAKLSLTLNELTLGKNPWQDGSVMENENAKRRKTRKQQNLPYKMNSQIMEMSSCNNNNVMPLPKGTEWATKELLDFVAHMKNGDASVLSPFDVELLLLEYIKRHNLRDPKQKSQILCDLRLVHLFGKPSVGHFEMMKLLESHFLIKEKSLVDDIGTVSEVASDQVKSKGNCDHQQPMGDSDRCKPLEKANERAQHIDSDEYAAIDVHNISLIFLQRKLIESLLNDTDRFHGKVVGSFVRLRVSSNDTKQDMYRLAQVIGTTKIAESYKVGERTSNLMLEVQNLDKKEALSIDSFSDQDFSEEECRCLRESVKCGLIRRFTVGEIRDKASTLQAVKANDIPISAEERQRRLHEIIEVHTDQNTDPSQVSEENAKKLNKINQEGIMTPNDSVSHRKDRELIYQQQGGNVLNFIGNTVSNNLACTSERSKNICTPFNLDKEGVNGTIKKVNETSTREREALVLNSWDASQKQSNFTSLLTSNDNPIVGSEALLPPFTSEIEHFVNEVEADRLWHYQDPAGKIQGPFSITQLHKWYSSRCFPTNLRVWRTNESQSEAVFLSDALNALYKYDKESQFLYNIHVLSKEDKPNFSGCDDKKDLVKGNGSASQSSDGPPSTSQRSGLEQVQDPLKDKNSWHGESQGHFSVPSPPLPEKPLELSRVSEVHAMERHSSPSKVNHNSQKNAEGETISCNSYEKSDSEDCSDQSSHGWDSKSSVVSLPTTIELPEQSQEIHIPNLPTTSGSKLDHVDLNDQSTEIKPSPFSCVTDQASDPIWTSSTLVAPMPTKPSIQEQDSSLIAESSLKPVEIINANVATPASVNDLPNDSHVSSWQAIIDGPDDEFDSLVDESVSDLLAEVEAMETLHALASSSTSMINCGGELTLGSKNYFFTSEPGFSPATEIGKSIHLTSSTDLQMTSQPATIPPTSHLSSSSVVVENAPIQPSVPSPSSLNIALGDTGWRTGSENAVPDWSPVQENNANMNWEYSNQGNADSGFGNFPARGNPVGFYSSQPRYNADRFPSPRERSFQDRDYGFGKGSRSSSWNRSQPSYGGGNGGSSSRPSPRGQRVCKFYENGYCRKGASCSYLHP